MSPELERAVDQLGERDRQSVLLRFYRQMSFAEVGRCLGISEKAAQKRVERAVGKLREKLAGKGVAVEAGSLGAMVLAHAVEGGMEGGAAGLVEKVMAGIGGGGCERDGRADCEGSDEDDDVCEGEGGGGDRAGGASGRNWSGFGGELAVVPRHRSRRLHKGLLEIRFRLRPSHCCSYNLGRFRRRLKCWILCGRTSRDIIPGM